MKMARWLKGPSTRAVGALALTQIVGWGTTYALPAMLADAIAKDINVAPSLIFAGVSVMLVVNATVSPLIGPWIDRLGARSILIAGSIVIAAGLMLMGICMGPVSYLLAWSVLGIGMATALTTPAFAALVEISGRGARRQIATLTLFTGLSTTIFWPVMLWLQGFLEWRGMVGLFAVLHLVVCLPLHAFLLPPRAMPIDAQATSGRRRHVISASMTVDAERRAFWLVAAAFSASGFVSWGLSVQLPDMFKSLGLSAASAITVAALAGPIQVTARAADMAMTSRTSALGVAILASTLLPCGLITLAAVAGIGVQDHGWAIGGILLFILAWGTANGLITVARAAVPLELFDPQRFGTAMGRLALMQNLAFAIGPVAMAAALHRFGVVSALLIATMFALAALGAMIALVHQAKSMRISGANYE